METLQPKLRFPQFYGNWSKDIFRDLVKINQGLQIQISERYLTQVEASHFYITNEFLKEGSEKKYFIKNPPPNVLCEYNDILMTRTGNTGMVVTNVKGAFHNNFFKINYPNTIVKGFLYYFLTTVKTQNIIKSLAGTSTIPDLNHTDFYKINFKYPSLEEQTKIANFLSSVDEKINLLKEKKSLLEEYKKGIMQKIFNQEIRFTDDDGNDFEDWVEKSLQQIAEVNKGNQLNKDDLNDVDIYPSISGGIEPSGYTDKYNRNENTIIISEGGNSCGYVNFIKTKFWCGGHCYSIDITDFENFDNEYLFQLLKFNQNEIMALRVGSGLPNIQKKDLKNFIISVSMNKSEQTKIANFLTSIDEKIELVKSQLQDTQEYKKGLLQQMFV